MSHTTTLQPAEIRANVRAYYAEATADYRAWSPGYNMHFGYYRRGINPFDREAMLEAMNHEVIRRCRLEHIPQPRVADLGCGLGATARSLAQARPDAQVDAVTIAPNQVYWARQLASAAGARPVIRFHLADYTASGLPSADYDAVYALESACHAAGADKRGLIDEAARLLKSGGRLVIADGFRRDSAPLRGFTAWVAAAFCRNWAVPELAERGAMQQALREAGFTDIQFEDISLRTAVSFAHVPWLSSKFTALELVRHRGRLSAWRWSHIKAGMLSPVLGLMLWRFGYFMVTARKI